MNEQTILEKLKEYNVLRAKHRKLVRTRDKAILLSNIVHALMLIVFAVNACLIIRYELIEGLLFIPVLKDVPALFPKFTATVKDFAIYGAVCVWGIPLLVAAIVCIAGKLIPAKVTPLDESKSLEKQAEKMQSELKYNKYYFYKGHILVFYLVVSILLGIGASYGLILEAKQANALTGEFVAGMSVGFIGSSLCFLACNGVLCGVFRLLQFFFTVENNKWWKKYRAAGEDCEKLYLSLVADREKKEKEKIAAKKAAHEKAEAERKKAEAKKAEKEFADLEGPDSNEAAVKKLADLGSASASLHYGKKLYTRCVTEALTKAEKAELIKKTTPYLKTSAETGNIEGEFLLLSLPIVGGTATLPTYQYALKRAREIKASGKLPENYSGAMESLIDGCIKAVDLYEAAQKAADAEAKRAPVIKRRYCRWYAGGKCLHSNTYVTNCRYPNNPGQCATALVDKGLMYEFE